MHRIKLNDRMTFPEELDMSPFIDVEDEVRAILTLSASNRFTLDYLDVKIY